MKENGAQTDERWTVDYKLKALEASHRARHGSTALSGLELEERLFVMQKDLEAKYEERLEVEMRRFRAVEATSIRLEEANRCAREMKQARADMDRWHEQVEARLRAMALRQQVVDQVQAQSRNHAARMAAVEKAEVQMRGDQEALARERASVAEELRGLEARKAQ